MCAVLHHPAQRSCLMTHIKFRDEQAAGQGCGGCHPRARNRVHLSPSRVTQQFHMFGCVVIIFAGGERAAFRLCGANAQATTSRAPQANRPSAHLVCAQSHEPQIAPGGYLGGRVTQLPLEWVDVRASLRSCFCFLNTTFDEFCAAAEACGRIDATVSQ